MKKPNTTRRGEVAPKADGGQTSLVGHVLTAASILVAALGVMWSWQQHRIIVVRSQAQEFRTAAADAIAALDRMQNLSTLLFDEVQPFLVQTSEMVAADPTVSNATITAARDFLWRSIDERKLEVLRSLATTSSRDPVARIYAYHPTVYKLARQAVAKQRSIFENAAAKLRDATEPNVLDLQKNRENFQTAALGKALRASTAKVKSEFIEESEQAISPFREFLAELVHLPDDRLARRELVPDGADAQRSE